MSIRKLFNPKLLAGPLLGLALGLTACSLITKPRPATDAVSLRDGLGLGADEGWTVLSRPNTLWTVGTVIEALPNGPIRDLGTLESLGCFPDSAWIVRPGTGPAIQYGRMIDYGLSVGATLGVSKVELAKAKLSLSSDGETPSHKSIVVLNKVSEQRVDTLKAEEFLQANYEAMSPACKRNLLDPTRYVIDKILVIEDGEINIVETGGAKVDLSAPQYKIIQDAAIKVGYSVTKDGSLKVPQGVPITFAVRQADFGSTLARMGIQRRSEGEALHAILLKTGEAVPY